MPTEKRFIRLDAKSLEAAQQARRPSLRIRWWVLPLALVLCVTQATLNLIFEANPTEILLNLSQIPVMALGFLMLLTLVINPLMRRWPVVAPFNRGEIMALVAAMAVSALITSTGMVDQLIPHITTPFNPNWNTPQRKLAVDVIPYINKSLYVTDPGEIVKWRTGIARMEDGFLDVLGRIPWHVWIKPVCLWLILFLAFYLMYYSLALLFFDSWSHQEKLVFPLARIPEAVLSDEGAEEGSYSSTYRSGLFWLGFGAVLALIIYNGACEAGWLSDFQPFTYGIKQVQLRQMLEKSIFRGIAASGPYGLTLAVSFVTIGIAFLLPLEISLSLWFYYAVALFMLMVGIWTAAGATVESFYSNPGARNNFVSALGSGGILAFAAIYLAKIASGRWPERDRGSGPFAMIWSVVRWDGLLFAISLAVAMVWYAWSGVAPVWAMGYLVIEVLITIAIMRIQSEGGLYWVQMHLSPFHIAKMIGGVQVIGPGDLSRLVMYHSSTVTYTKTNLAPAVLNAFKMQEEGRAAGRRFHLIVVMSILVTMVACVVSVLYLSYRIGGNRMNDWFYTRGPQQTIDFAQRFASGGITAKGELHWLYYLIGAGWVALSMGMRRHFFWWLHPIGFVMISGAPMRGLWFSFFIGWLCKSVVVRYGGRHTFVRLRPLFLGFIFAEIVGALGWGILSQTLGLEHVGINFFNRSEP